MSFSIEFETSDGEYYFVDDIDSYDDLKDWLEYIDDQYDVVDVDYEYAE